jgi:hypothetical protein
MNRKHLPLVVSLLALLLLAASCPLSSATSPGQATATATATVASVPTSTETPAPTDTVAAPTNTQLPSATPSSTDTPGPTNTPTEAPPLAAIADVCKLLDTKSAGDLLGDNMVKTQKFAQPGSWYGCSMSGANGSTGLILSVAQDKVAVDLHVSGYAQINAAKGCAMPVPVGAAALKKEHDAFDKLGLTGNKLVHEAYSRGYMLIKDKGCTDQYGVQAIPGLGDEANADHIWGYEEMGTVYRNTVIYIVAYKKAITAAQAVDIDQKLLAPVIKQLQTQ